MNKYTKTQLRKDQVAAVIDTLEHEFDAQIDDADGGRMDVIINGFQGQFSRRDFDVTFFDSIPLQGDGIVTGKPLIITSIRPPSASSI